MDSVAELEKDKETIQGILRNLGLTVNQWNDKKMYVLPHEGCGDLIDSVILEIIGRGSVNLKYGPILQKIRMYDLKDKLQRLFSYSKVINGPFPAGAQNVYVIVHSGDNMKLERTTGGYLRFPSFRDINVSDFLSIAQRWIRNMELVRDIYSSNMFAIIRCREKFLDHPLRDLFPDVNVSQHNIRGKYNEIEVSETLGLVRNDMTLESTRFFKDLINTMLSPNMQPSPNFTPSSAPPAALAPPPPRSAPPSKIILVILGPQPDPTIYMEEKIDNDGPIPHKFYGFPLFQTMNKDDFERTILRPNIDVMGISRINVPDALVYICSCQNETQFHDLTAAAKRHYHPTLQQNLKSKRFSEVYSSAIHNYNNIGTGARHIIMKFINMDGSVKLHY